MAFENWIFESHIFEFDQDQFRHSNPLVSDRESRVLPSPYLFLAAELSTRKQAFSSITKPQGSRYHELEFLNDTNIV